MINVSKTKIKSTQTDDVEIEEVHDNQVTIEENPDENHYKPVVITEKLREKPRENPREKQNSPVTIVEVLDGIEEGTQTMTVVPMTPPNKKKKKKGLCSFFRN